MEALGKYDPEVEARDLQAMLSRALQHTALAELGAVGLGAGLAVVLHGLAADVTGITAGLMAAVLGLSILPRRKKAAQRRIDAGLDQLQSELQSGLQATLNGELERAAGRFRALYRDHCEELDQAAQETLALQQQLNGLENRSAALLEELKVK